MAKTNSRFWTSLQILFVAIFGLFLIYPLFSLFSGGFQNARTGEFSLMHFERFFTRPFVFRALIRSFTVSTWTTFFAVLIGAPLAYLTTMYKVKFKRAVDILVIISMLSPPFIGAYSWILLAGRNGMLANFFMNNFGIQTPSIYGFGGIVLVMTLSSYPLMYLFTSGALKKVDASLIEASASLGSNPFRTIFKVTMPLIIPTILAGALLVFMDTMADFGTPMLIGEGYVVMPVLIFNEFIGEMGGQPNFAAALAVIMMVVTVILFSIQKYIIARKSFTMSSLRPLQVKKLKGAPNVIMHVIIYLVVALATIPQTIVIYTSFRATRGPIFIEGYNLGSYRAIFRTLGSSITNTYVLGLAAIIIIVVFSMCIAYITIRRRSVITNVLDTVTMLPFVIPGSVIGIALVMAFNTQPLLLTGTAFILVLAFVIRRLPFTLRSSSAILHNISPSLEEAAISLGDSPAKGFFKITAILMLPGVISGAILSWVTIINELSASVMLFTIRTRTLTVAIYQEVVRASYGTAAALSTILTLSTIISLIIFFKLTGKTEISL